MPAEPRQGAPSKAPASLARWGALAAILGGVLWAAKVALDFAAGTGGTVADDAFFVAPLLMFAGLAGFYGRYSGLVQGIGNTGFVQGFIGLGLLAGGFLADLTLGVEGGARVASFGFLVLTLGLVLVGLDVLKFELLRRWSFLPLALGLVIPMGIISGEDAFLRTALSVLFGLGWAVLGFVLLARGEPEPGARRVP